jgi:Ca2+-binding RTX toxin-like protein
MWGEGIKRTLKAGAITLPAAAAIQLLAPLSASAATVSIGPGHFPGDGAAMIVRDDAGANDELGVERGNATGTFADSVSDEAGITAIPPCVADSPTLAHCLVDTHPAGVEIFSGGGRDRLLLGQGPGPAFYVKAGSGNDHVLGSSGNDIVYGESGNDVLSGDQGSDSLVGGSGADRIVGSIGDDFLSGGSGNDGLFGGGGRDLLIGGSGNRDRCVGGPGPEHVIGCELGDPSSVGHSRAAFMP